MAKKVTKKATKKAAEKKYTIMVLKNGLMIKFDPEEKLYSRNGLIYVHAIAINGTRKAPVTIVYNKADGIVVRVTTKKAADRELAHMAYIGIRETSGTWQRKDAGQRRRSKTWHPGETVKTYTPKVYFWAKRVFDENGNVVGRNFCHSAKLVGTDPMGAKLYADWASDPEGFMSEHPELCRGRTI